MPAPRPGTGTRQNGPSFVGLLLGGIGFGLLLLIISAAAIFGGGEAVVDSASACGGESEGEDPSSETSEGIPENYLKIYKAAGDEYGIPWQILAGIGSIETDHGRLDAPGVDSGENSSGAGGPMQFLQPTWDAYGVDGDKDGDKDRYDPADAIPGAANYLTASGIRDSIREAIFAYNHADWYVADVISRAQGYGWSGDGEGGISTAGAPGGGSGDSAGPSSGEEVTDACDGEFPSGPAELGEAVKLTSPREYVKIPPEFTGGTVQLIDARILPNVVWIAKTYGLTITQGRSGPGSPSQSHNYGTAIDAVPAGGNTQAIWDESAGRLAADLGWKPACGGSGVRPACALVPAIRFIGYDGYESHGSPKTCTGQCPAHIHVSWEAGPNAVYDGVARPPLEYVLVFPSPDGASGSEEPKDEASGSDSGDGGTSSRSRGSRSSTRTTSSRDAARG